MKFGAEIKPEVQKGMYPVRDAENRKILAAIAPSLAVSAAMQAVQTAYLLGRCNGDPERSRLKELASQNPTFTSPGGLEELYVSGLQDAAKNALSGTHENE